MIQTIQATRSKSSTCILPRHFTVTLVTDVKEAKQRHNLSSEIIIMPKQLTVCRPLSMIYLHQVGEQDKH